MSGIQRAISQECSLPCDKRVSIALLSRNVKAVEQIGNGYHHTQAIGYQQSPQVSIQFVMSLTSAMLAQQLPLLSKFSGETNDEDMDTFWDWLDQFKMLASVCEWFPLTKLVNLITRLLGQAYAFFCSCTT